MQKKSLFHIIIFIVLGFGYLYANPNPPIQIKNAPSWVVQNKVDIPKTIPVNDIENGIYYLYMDKQIKVEENQKTLYFSRFAKLVVNQEGLEEVSQINLNYDPLYEKVVLNSLVIHRDGQSIDKTASARITTIQRETDLEEQLYNGQLTANIIIDDVRVSDVVEYSFTYIGTNPVYKDLFSYNRYTQWDVPVHDQYLRVLWKKPNPLHIKMLNAEYTIEEKEAGAFKEYSLMLHDIPHYRANTETPKWFHPYASIYFYETQSWADIAKWAASIYDNVIENTDEVNRIAKDINTTYHTPKEQVAAALNYVQSNIRYLGIEMGTNSHMPSPPNETLSRRYGDCKDKTVLFISLS